VVFECAHEGRICRSTFLPQVWKQLPQVVNFMAHLKVKADSPGDFWSPAVQVSVYQVQKFHKSPPGAVVADVARRAVWAATHSDCFSVAAHPAAIIGGHFGRVDWIPHCC